MAHTITMTTTRSSPAAPFPPLGGSISGGGGVTANAGDRTPPSPSYPFFPDPSQTVTMDMLNLAANSTAPPNHSTHTNDNHPHGTAAAGHRKIEFCKSSSEVHQQCDERCFFPTFGGRITPPPPRNPLTALPVTVSRLGDLGISPSDSTVTTQRKRFSCSFTAAFGALLGLLLIYAGVSFLQTCEETLPFRLVLVGASVLSLLTLGCGCVLYSKTKLRFFLDLAIFVSVFAIVPFALFASSFSSTGPGFMAVTNPIAQGPQTQPPPSVKPTPFFDILLAWMVAGPVFWVCQGYSRKQSRLVLLASLGIVFVANVLLLTYSSDSVTRSAITWFGEIILILFRLVPIVVVYMCVTSEGYVTQCGQAIVRRQIEDCQVIAERISHMDFDFLKLYEEGMSTEERVSVNDVQKLLFKIVEGLREYKAFLPSTLFHDEELAQHEVQELKLHPTPQPLRLPPMPVAEVTSGGTSSEPTGSLGKGCGSSNDVTSFRPASPQSAPALNRSTSQPSSPSTKQKASFTYRQTQGSPSRIHSMRPMVSPLQSPRAPMRNILIPKTITMAVIRLRGFFENEKELNAQAIQQINEAFIEIVDRAVKINKGTLHSFECGLAIAHWNAHVPMVGHTRSACAAVWEIHKKIQPKITEWRKDEHLGISIHIGVANGPMICGHTGTAEARRFNLFGPLWPLCHMLSKASVNLGVPILATRSVSEEAKFHFRFRSAALITYSPTRSQAGGLASPVNPTAVFDLCGVLCSSASNIREEWMYEVDKSEKTNPYAEFESGFELMVGPNADLNQAIIHFSRYQEQHPTYDKLCRVLVRMCHRSVSSSNGSSPFPLIWREDLGLPYALGQAFPSSLISIDPSLLTGQPRGSPPTGRSNLAESNFFTALPLAPSITSMTSYSSPHSPSPTRKQSLPGNSVLGEFANRRMSSSLSPAGS